MEFEHFFGVTPRRYREVFERSRRKNDEDGSFQDYVNGEPAPIINIKYPFYHQLEDYITGRAMEALEKVASSQELVDI